MADLFCLLRDRLDISELGLLQDQGFVCLHLGTFFILWILTKTILFNHIENLCLLIWWEIS